MNPTNNQFTGSSYDLNGNMILGVGATLGYDEANRLSSVSPTSGGTGYYGYAPDNKRIYQALPGRWGMQEAWTFYGAHGEKLGVYQWFDVRGDGTCTGGCALQPQTWNVWFGGKMIYEGGSSVYEVGTAAGATYHDRVGTNRANGARFYPYGDQISGIASDHEMFGTYQRDGFTGLDYADQRYYASSYGRYNTVDPLQSSAKPNNPGSWNRYAYVGGDPVNLLDPRGMESSGCGPDWVGDASLSGPCCPPGGNGVNGFLPDPSFDPGCYVTGNLPEATGGSSCPSWAASDVNGNVVRFVCLHQSGSDWNELAGIDKSLNAALAGDPDCEGYLATGPGGMDAVQTLLTAPLSENFTLASYIISPGGPSAPPIDAVTHPGIPNGTPFVINSESFFNKANLYSQFLVLLHEFGHYLNPKGYQVDSADGGAATAANDKLITDNCSKALNFMQ